MSGGLAAREKALVTKEICGISGMVCWEIAKLHQLGRIGVSLEDPDLIRFIDRLTIWPVDRDVCEKLPQLDFVSDPADELIAATSIAHSVPLLTRDRRIRSSRKVPLA
jgi:PIN domain nuclease of toxin-antitoxin system